MNKKKSVRDIQKAARVANRYYRFKYYWLSDAEALLFDSAGHLVTHTIYGPSNLVTYRLHRDPVYYHRWVELEPGLSNLG